MKSDAYLPSHTQTHSRWIKGLDGRPETINPLEENRTKLHNIQPGNDFLIMTPKAQVINEKTDKLDFMKFLKLCASKGSLQSKRHHTKREETFANPISNKGFTSRI